ncbi:hypothetical protein V6R21_24815 [Limibacter armeniacum]|uniref:hypothetical protein n=1 Tax=Limibacter armeniacum TaxID=466084 RepID=UPI002FE64C2E
MSITIKNYLTQRKDINFSQLPDALQKTDQQMEKLLPAYSQSEAIKRVVDLYLDKLNKAVDKQEKPKAAPKTKASKATAAAKSLAELKRFLKKGMTLYVVYGGKSTFFNEKNISHFTLSSIKEKVFAEKEKFKRTVTKVGTSDFTTSYEGNKDSGVSMTWGKATEWKFEKGYVQWISSHKDGNDVFFFFEDPIKSGLLQSNKEGATSIAKTVKKAPAPKAATTKKQPTLISHFTEDIRLLRRFKALIGKEKTRKQLLGVYQDMERRMVEQKVQKEAKYASLLQQAHQLLAQILKNTKEEELVNVEIKSKAGQDFFEKVVHAANENRVRTSVVLLKSFIGLEGSINPDKPKVERLLNRINSALGKEQVTSKDIFHKEIKEAKSALNQYLQAKESMIPISPMALNGIHCACGLSKK